MAAPRTDRRPYGGEQLSAAGFCCAPRLAGTSDLDKSSTNHRAYESVTEARASIGRYLDFYNRRRPHSSLDGMTPDWAYFGPLPARLAA